MENDLELWICQGFLGGKYLSILSEVQDPFSPSQESLANILRVVAQKRRSRPQAIRTAVVDEEDFQSVSFLQGGSRKANAVCRIAREFSLDEFRNFIRTIQNSDKFDTQSFDSIAKIKEIFSIPDEMIDRLFKPVFKPVFKPADSNEPQPPLSRFIAQHH